MSQGLTACQSGSCVEVTVLADGVRLTSTLGLDKGAVYYTHTEWAEFLDGVRAGTFDGTVAEPV